MKYKIGETALVYHTDYGNVKAVWSKASHIPIYGWADVSQEDVEDWDLLEPQPTFIVRIEKGWN